MGDSGRKNTNALYLQAPALGCKIVDCCPPTYPVAHLRGFSNNLSRDPEVRVTPIVFKARFGLESGPGDRWARSDVPYKSCNW